MLRTTRLSSTSITRRVRAVGSLSGIRGCGWATERTSGDADELQFSFERFAIERLHHIFVGTRLDRGADMVDSVRSEEHTSELQSLMRISYAVFCLKKKQRPT